MKTQISRMIYYKFADRSPDWPAYNPSAGFDWIRHESKLPWLPLQIEIPYEIMMQEIPSIVPWIVEHREHYGEHTGWKSFCLHGKSHDATREDSYYNDDRPHIWTDLAKKLMPKTVEYFQRSWPAEQYRRLRIMLLEPGGGITVHSDSDISRLSPVNIALTQPDDCGFVMEKHGTVPFSPGQAIWLDVSNRHVVFNDSDQPRWHIIVHQDLEHIGFQNLVVKSYHRLYNSVICDRQL